MSRERKKGTVSRCLATYPTQKNLAAPMGSLSRKTVCGGAAIVSLFLTLEVIVWVQDTGRSSKIIRVLHLSDRIVLIISVPCLPVEIQTCQHRLRRLWGVVGENLLQVPCLQWKIMVSHSKWGISYPNRPHRHMCRSSRVLRSFRWELVNDDILAVLVIVELRRPEQLVPTDGRILCIGLCTGSRALGRSWKQAGVYEEL